MATIKDIAREAGVSVTTVSYVINRNRGVKRETAEKVLKVIEKHNFIPNSTARSLVTKSTQTIGVLVSNISNSFFSPIVRGVEDVAYGSGFIVMVGNSDESPDKARSYLEILKNNRIDGLIISPPPHFDDFETILENFEIPVVFINRRLESMNYDLVESNNKNGAFQAIDKLIEMGHSQIGVVTRPTDVSTYADRLNGIREAFSKNNLPFNLNHVCTVDTACTNEPEVIQTFLKKNANLTALFVCSGTLTKEAIRAIKSLGIRIPDDLSLIGFDETDWATLIDPPLTTIAQKTYETGRTAAEILLERIAEISDKGSWWEEEVSVREKLSRIEPKRICLDPDFIQRDSIKSI